MPTRRARTRRRFMGWRRHMYLKIPLWVRKRDFELFTAVLCFLAGVPLLISDEVQAASLEAALPNEVVTVWAAVLTVAPIGIVLGIWQSHKRMMQNSLPWLRLEALGLRALAYVAYLYGVIILIVLKGDAGAAPFLIFVFALTCHSRAVYLTLKVENYLWVLAGGEPRDDLD